ncbi:MULTISPECIES: DNA/RNA non-specific endonuclease [unclassified Microbacterium]|uniref:DNA/RNA non-specific endonuclease n=1 Tax=unclassified Microbacterium TaxID=2609290 RepID=UPI0008F47748|nr:MULTISPECIES: DNA/RNA non-specific endonuclease [unclassified Microbacterium]OIJ32948.1 endonuclease [Microbacterium sp. LCT-H2]
MTDGYDPGFLGIPLPLPAPPMTVRTLPAPRFTVLLDPERRLAAVTAVTIDGARLRDLPRTGEWHLDPRVPEEEQAGPAVYAGNDLDRGHLVRRRDPGWGELADARAAMEATFTYPNAAPQAAVFNQSKDLWLGLEDHVLVYAETTAQRLTVFTAPVLDEADPPYRGIRVPLRYWKIAAWNAGGRLAAAAFLLDQSALVDTREGALAVASLEAFRTFQVRVAEVSALTGIDLGPLSDADVLPRRGIRESGWRPLHTADDIVV